MCLGNMTFTAPGFVSINTYSLTFINQSTNTGDSNCHIFKVEHICSTAVVGTLDQQITIIMCVLQLKLTQSSRVPSLSLQDKILLLLCHLSRVQNMSTYYCCIVVSSIVDLDIYDLQPSLDRFCGSVRMNNICGCIFRHCSCLHCIAFQYVNTFWSGIFKLHTKKGKHRLRLGLILPSFHWSDSRALQV